MATGREEEDFRVRSDLKKDLKSHDRFWAWEQEGLSFELGTIFKRILKTDDDILVREGRAEGF